MANFIYFLLVAPIGFGVLTAVLAAMLAWPRRGISVVQHLPIRRLQTNVR